METDGRTPVQYRLGLTIAGALLGVMLSSVTVMTATRAAFSDQTSNSGNSVDTGDVTLTDNDLDVALFTITDLVPAGSESTCIEVTYSGSIPDPGVVKVYSGGFTDSNALADHLNITIEESTAIGLPLGICTGFDLGVTSTVFDDTLTVFGGLTDYAAGAGTWDPSGTPESRSYRITVELDSGADPVDAQGESITGLIFTWEVQS